MGKAALPGVFTWAYILWSIVPVLIAVQFSFNATRSRTVWDSFSTRWYWGDPVDSVWHDPTLRHALVQSFKLAGADVLIAVPIGVLLALGLARWRGRGSGTSNFIMLFPLVTPEIVMGVSLLLVFTHIFTFVHTGTIAQILGHVTFSISFVVVIVRGRLFSIGRQYEEAAADLGASPFVALRASSCPCSPRRSSPRPPWCSPSRPTTSSSASGCQAADPRTPSRSRSTQRRAPRRYRL
jgi:spermidine/putrescine transport system permease protein